MLHRLGVGQRRGFLVELLRKLSDSACFKEDLDSPLSSPSKIPGIPTRSKGIPSSASASMLRACSLAKRDEYAAEVYCPLESPVSGMFNSLGGNGGGGRVLEYRIRAI